MNTRVAGGCRRSRGGLLLIALLAVPACSNEGAESVAPPQATSFCEVHPRFAEQLNMALANADPDTEQWTVMGEILGELEPVIQELGVAEPAELAGTVDQWVSDMRAYADGDREAIGPAEEARQRMDDWVTDNC